MARLVFPLFLLFTGCVVSADADGDGLLALSAGGTDCDDRDPTVGAAVLWYDDVDNDGFGRDQTATPTCFPAPGQVDEGGDCDDNDPDEYPGVRWYQDADGDGFGSPLAASSECARGRDAIYVDNDEDCNDGLPDVNPAATEICGTPGLDEDCNGLVDDADPGIDPSTLRTVFADADLDGFGAADALPELHCNLPHFATNTEDCADNNASIRPGAVEVAGDLVDSDCDGAELCFCDGDGDGIGSDLIVLSTDVTCTAQVEPSGEVLPCMDFMVPVSRET